MRFGEHTACVMRGMLVLPHLRDGRCWRLRYVKKCVGGCRQPKLVSCWYPSRRGRSRDRKESDRKDDRKDKDSRKRRRESDEGRKEKKP